MYRKRLAMLAALVAAGAVALTACSTAGSAAPDTINSNHQPGPPVLTADVHEIAGTALANNAADNTGDFSGSRTNPVAQNWTQVSASAAGDLNPVLINAVGRTLYRFDKDTAHPSKSNCDGSCAVKWPPVLVKPGATIFVDGVSPSEIGTVKRDDGTVQVTVGGWPAYTFSGDSKAGDINGEGVGGTWYGLTPTGGKAEPASSQTSSDGVGYVTGSAASNHAPSNTGDFFNGPNDSPQGRKWVQLNSSSANGLNPVVENGTGFVLYRFDKDTTHPSKSNCDGACAIKWPPVEVVPGSHIFVNGVPASEIGLVKRDDGMLQVTIGGSPVYRFSGDTAPGQTNGEGVDGTWYAVGPDGSKIEPPAGGSGVNNAGSGAAASTTATPPTSGESSSVTLGNGSVTLFDSVNPADDTSQGVSGPGCQNVGRPNVANRLELDGGPIKVWTGLNCTGTSHVVTASIPDLNTIGFGDKIESIRFGS